MNKTQWAPALIAALRAELDKARLVLVLAGEGEGFA